MISVPIFVSFLHVNFNGLFVRLVLEEYPTTHTPNERTHRISKHLHLLPTVNQDDRQAVRVCLRVFLNCFCVFVCLYSQVCFKRNQSKYLLCQAQLANEVRTRAHLEHVFILLVQPR